MRVGCPCILLSERRVLQGALSQILQLRHGLTCLIQPFETNRTVASHQHTRPMFDISACKSLNRMGRKSALLPRAPQHPGLTPIGLACGESISTQLDLQSLAAAGFQLRGQRKQYPARSFPGRPPRRSRTRPPCAARELSSRRPACSSLHYRIRSHTRASDSTCTRAKIRPACLWRPHCWRVFAGSSDGRFPGLRHDRVMDPRGWLPFSGFGLEEAVEILSMPQNRMFETTIEHVCAVCPLLHPLRRGVFRDRWWQLLIDVGLRVAGARPRFRQGCRGLKQFDGEHCWQRRRKRRLNRSVHNSFDAPSGLLGQHGGRI